MKMNTGTSQILNTGKDAIKEVERLTMDTLSSASERATETGKKVTKLIREQPILAVSGMFALGFLLAKIIKFRRTND